MDTADVVELTLDDLIKCDYQSVVSSCEQNVHQYSCQLFKAAQKAKEEGNILKSKALSLLSAACSPALNPSDPKEPFKAYFIWQDQRSTIPADFSKEQGVLFALFAPKVECPELASRLADLSWLISRNIASANYAIDSYVRASQSSFCKNNVYEAIKRLERALRIAISINNENKDSIVKRLLAYIDIDDEAYDLRTADTICELFLDTGAVLSNIIAEKALFLAEQVKASVHEFKCSLLRLAIRAFLKSNQHEKVEEIKLKIAEVLLQKAEHAEISGEMILASHWYSQAINQLQQCKGQKEKILRLQPKIQMTIKESFKEMKNISVEMDSKELTKFAIQETKLIISEDRAKTLIYFALFLTKPLKRKELEKNAIELAKNNPISSTISASIYNGEGRLVAIQEPLLGSKEKKYEEALKAASFKYASYLYQITYSIIFYVCDEINKIHNIDEKALYEILQHSPFIPNDRLNLWIKGFLAGFRGEFDVALSLLIPQFEHALRKVLDTKGAIVWRIDPKTGFHSEVLFNQLLELKETRELLGEDLQFELQGLLTERLGFNYRNEFAHGLVPEKGFYSPAAIYIWWLFLHIAVSHKQGSYQQSDGYQDNTQQQRKEKK